MASRVPRLGFLCTPAGVRAIAAAVDAGGYDVVHCHASIVSPAAFAGASAAVRLGIPAVLTFHSFVPHTPLLARGLDAALHTSTWPIIFSAVSGVVASRIRPAAGVAPIQLLPNGVDAGFWRVTRPARASSRIELVCVARLNAKKRLHALVRMMATLDQCSPDLDRRLRIAGDGPARGALENAISRSGQAGRIELLGRLSRYEIRDLLGDSDIFVLPTIRESFGIAAMEARCVGLPIVAMANSGVAEHVVHGVNGLVAANDDDFAVQVDHLARQPSLRAAISATNRTTIPAADWSAVIPLHVETYNRARARMLATR